MDADAGLPQFAGAQVQLERAKPDERSEGSAHGRIVVTPCDAAAWYHAGYLEPYLADSLTPAPSPGSATDFTCRSLKSPAVPRILHADKDTRVSAI